MEAVVTMASHKIGITTTMGRKIVKTTSMWGIGNN